MTRHGPTWPRAEAIALRSTGQAVLDAGDTRIGTDFGAPCGDSSDRNEFETLNRARKKPRRAVTTLC